MAKETYRDLKKRAKAARIVFSPLKYNRALASNIPSEHKDTFDQIQSLGRMQAEVYYASITPDSRDKPWLPENANRASKLVSFAAKCRRENRNEAGWRYEAESRLFERFDIEVAWSVDLKFH
jgi:hypothetical protein